MKIAYELTGLPIETASCLIVWGHGWGQNRDAFRLLAQSLAGRAAHLLLDFPGFGDSPPPPGEWGTAEYADAVAELIRPFRSLKRVIWVGHSFGGRVGLQLAARHPGLADGLFLVAAAGLPRRRSLPDAIRYHARVRAFKILKRLVPLWGGSVEDLRRKFGSADYKTAGPLRTVFIRVVNEDLSSQARSVSCPVQLVYGENDRETPPDIGQRLAQLIPGARLSILPGQDHYSVLGAGRHLVLKRLSDFMERLSQ